MIVDIDTEEWEDYKVFCNTHEIKPEIVYEGEYSLMVKIPVELIFAWAMLITIGEDLDDHYYNHIAEV